MSKKTFSSIILFIKLFDFSIVQIAKSTPGLHTASLWECRAMILRLMFSHSLLRYCYFSVTILTKGRTYMARLRYPKICLSIKSSETIDFPPLVGAKYIKFLFPQATSGFFERHSTCQGNKLCIFVCLQNQSHMPCGKPQYSNDKEFLLYKFFCLTARPGFLILSKQ